MTNNINIKEIWQEVLGRAEYGSKFIQFIPSNDIQELPKMKLYLSHDKTNLPALEVNLGPTGRGDLVPKKYQGFEVAVERLQWGIDPPSDMAIIFCKVDSLEDVFQRFVQNIVDSLSAGQTPYAAVATAIKKWVAFFASSASRKNPQELIGLFGELKFLGERLNSAKDHVLTIDCWKGPEGNSWDFIFPDKIGACFVEVKTTGLHERKIIVNGIDQLWPADTVNNNYWLYWLQVNWTKREDLTNKGSILELMEALQAQCSAVGENVRFSLDEILRNIGLLDLDAETYQDYQSIKIIPGRVSWISIDTDFPALHRGNVSNPAVLDRVSQLHYSLTLKDEDIVRHGPIFSEI